MVVDEKRKNALSHLLCSRCVYDARPHLKHAPKPHLGYIIFSFFCLLQIHSWVRMGILQKDMDFHGIKSQKADILIVVYT